MDIRKADIRLNVDGSVELLLTVQGDKGYLSELVKRVNEKPHTVEIEPLKRKRSLDANAYLWVLMGKMAEVLKTSKDEVYLEMLDRYGIFTHIVVKPNMVEKVKAEWKIVRELGEVTINGKVGIQLQCYFGSSTYNQKEFAHLLDGTISEAKEIGVDTASQAETERMIREWAN
jgi:hypothetical protein